MRGPESVRETVVAVEFMAQPARRGRVREAREERARR
jgi:hypothetical protein